MADLSKFTDAQVRAVINTYGYSREELAYQGSPWWVPEFLGAELGYAAEGPFITDETMQGMLDAIFEDAPLLTVDPAQAEAAKPVTAGEFWGRVGRGIKEDLRMAGLGIGTVIVGGVLLYYLVAKKG